MKKQKDKKRRKPSHVMLNRKNKNISDAVMDQIIHQIVEKKRNLREIAFELNVGYATLVRRIRDDHKAKELLDEARELTIFEVSEDIIRIADETTIDSLEIDKFRVSARKDAMSIISRSRESLSRQKATNTTAAPPAPPNVQVGIVIVPPKAEAPAMLGQNTRPRLAVIDGKYIEHAAE